jgi:hypothetical protein
MRERPCRIVACSEQKASGRAETSRGCAQSRTAFLYDTLLVPVSITSPGWRVGFLTVDARRESIGSDRGCIWCHIDANSLPL